MMKLLKYFCVSGSDRECDSETASHSEYCHSSSSVELIPLFDTIMYHSSVNI